MFTIVDTCNKAIYIKLTSSECVALSRNIKDFNKKEKEKVFFPLFNILIHKHHYIQKKIKK